MSHFCHAFVAFSFLSSPTSALGNATQLTLKVASSIQASAQSKITCTPMPSKESGSPVTGCRLRIELNQEITA